jgi:hypothetical protein
MVERPGERDDRRTVQERGEYFRLFPNLFDKKIEEEVGDDATAKLFEYCDPRPVDGEGSGTSEESLGRVSFGGEDWQRKEAKELMSQLSTVLSEDLTKAKQESKAPLFRIDLKEGFRTARARPGPMRRRSEEEQRLIDDFNKTMADAGLIKECRVPQAADLVLVRQKSKIRICIYRLQEPELDYGAGHISSRSS